MDLVALIEQRAPFGLRRAANHFRDGVEYCGPCPFCATGTDRFRVWPEAEYPHYWCRKCGARGTAVRFLMEYCGMTVSEALAELGIEDEQPYRKAARQPDRREQPPARQWQETGKALVQQAESALWRTKEGRPLLNYLRGRRLSDNTIRQAHLGYMPRDKDGRWLVMPYQQWGFDPESLPASQQEVGGVRIGNGLLIPSFEGPQLWGISIRRVAGLDHTPVDAQRYAQIMGSGDGLYNVDHLSYDKPAVMVEGPIDALSVQQEAGDLVSCVATGSATRGRLNYWRDLLAMAPYILQSFDSDGSGEQGACYWQQQFPHVLRWTTMLWKDPNDLLQSEPNGTCTLRQWVEHGIEAAQREFGALL
ncbi:MAG TPA: CHC2 zinc finger domain-containing protein [Ktedonosporobacter sp.]|nr:CHC2 zinc finger domain-containing protein [Ktedonosporobacter sp.]